MVELLTVLAPARPVVVAGCPPVRKPYTLRPGPVPRLATVRRA